MGGYLVDYERVPITDEKAPKEMDFDALVQKHLGRKLSLIPWNCVVFMCLSCFHCDFRFTKFLRLM